MILLNLFYPLLLFLPSRSEYSLRFYFQPFAFFPLFFHSSSLLFLFLPFFCLSLSFLFWSTWLFSKYCGLSQCGRTVNYNLLWLFLPYSCWLFISNTDLSSWAATYTSEDLLDISYWMSRHNFKPVYASDFPILLVWYLLGQSTRLRTIVLYLITLSLIPCIWTVCSSVDAAFVMSSTSLRYIFITPTANMHLCVNNL